MRLRKKEAFSSFVQSGNIEVPSRTGFEPGTLRVTAGPLIQYTKLPYNFFFKKFKPNFKRFMQSLSSSVASQLDEQSAVSFEKTKNKKCLYLLT